MAQRFEEPPPTGKWERSQDVAADPKLVLLAYLQKLHLLHPLDERLSA